MSIKDNLQAAIGALQALVGSVEELDAVRSDVSSAKSELLASQRELTATRAQSKTAAATVSAGQLQAAKELEEALLAKRQELHSVTMNLEQAKNEHASLAAQVNAKRALHEQLESSLESLRKRFA